jgi:hypothetical protein
MDREKHVLSVNASARAITVVTLVMVAFLGANLALEVTFVSKGSGLDSNFEGLQKVLFERLLYTLIR